jgi:hypothetical protein
MRTIFQPDASRTPAAEHTAQPGPRRSQTGSTWLRRRIPAIVAFLILLPGISRADTSPGPKAWLKDAVSNRSEFDEFNSTAVIKTLLCSVDENDKLKVKIELDVTSGTYDWKIRKGTATTTIASGTLHTGNGWKHPPTATPEPDPIMLDPGLYKLEITQPNVDFTRRIDFLAAELSLDHAQLELLATQKWEVKLEGGVPPGVTISNYKFEMQRETETTWHEMQTGTSAVYNKKPKVAGKFKVVAILSVNGQDVRTNEEDLEVRFPNGSVILGGTGVQARMNQAWQDTLNATTTTSRREEGYYITLDTDSENYSITAHTIGTPVANNVGAVWDTVTVPRPPDVPAAPVPTDKPTYTVAWYHTHTPTTHRTLGRGVGPSSADFTFGSSIDIPGYAHDYTAAPTGSGTIPAGHPMNGAHQVYEVNPPDRRPTP